MTTWKPGTSYLRVALPIGAVLSLLLAYWLWSLMTSRLVALTYDSGVFLLGLGCFLSLVQAGMLAYLWRCQTSIRYRVDSDNLTILCAGVTYRVPLASITGVLLPADSRPPVRWRPYTVTFPGYYVGGGRAGTFGSYISVATMPAASQVFVTTRGLAFGVSPADSAGFAESLRKAIEGRWVEAAMATVELAGLAGVAASLYSNRAARTLLPAGLVANALFFAYMSFAYASLPSRVSIHWNAQAQVDVVDDPVKLLRLPLFALTIWLVNAVAAWWSAPRERALTLLLLAGAVAAQLVLWLGAISIVLRNR